MNFFMEKQNSDLLYGTVLGVLVSSFIDILKSIPNWRESTMFMMVCIFIFIYHIWILLNRKKYFHEESFLKYVIWYLVMNCIILTILLESIGNNDFRLRFYHCYIILFLVIFLWWLFYWIFFSQDFKNFYKDIWVYLKKFYIFIKNKVVSRKK